MVLKTLISLTSMQNFDIPILFLTYNRYEKTLKSFEKIRELKPLKLYFFSDGPKDLSDEKKINRIRKYVLQNIDWNCDINERFNAVNYGCRNGVSSAINWFFETNKMGIIIEDDCIPDTSFFDYCKDLLLKYQNDDRVMHISGSNNGLLKTFKEDYYFSKYSLIWGWATWKRSWDKYDLELQSLPRNIFRILTHNSFGTLHEKIYWLNSFISMYLNKHNTWDLSWFYTCVINGFSIIPSINMIKNIGFDEEATHTKINNISMEYKSNQLHLKNHPKEIIHIKSPDHILFKSFFKPRNILIEFFKLFWNFIKLIKKK